MTQPRKAAARAKAPAKKAAPSPHRDKIVAFEEFRDRARTSGLRIKGTQGVPPYVLGADRGFDPPIEIRWPTSLLAREDFDLASRHLDVFGMLRILLGTEYRRVLEAFDTFDDSDELMIGLVMKIVDHFNGVGASDAGGTPAS